MATNDKLTAEERAVLQSFAKRSADANDGTWMRPTVTELERIGEALRKLLAAPPRADQAIGLLRDEVQTLNDWIAEDASVIQPSGFKNPGLEMEAHKLMNIRDGIQNAIKLLGQG